MMREKDIAALRRIASPKTNLALICLLFFCATMLCLGGTIYLKASLKFAKAEGTTLTIILFEDIDYGAEYSGYYVKAREFAWKGYFQLYTAFFITFFWMISGVNRRRDKRVLGYIEGNEKSEPELGAYRDNAR